MKISAFLDKVFGSLRMQSHEPPKALLVSESERAYLISPIDMFCLSLAEQNMIVREKRGDKITFDVRDI